MRTKSALNAKTRKDMKLVELIIDDDSEVSGIQAVSLVKFPAIQEHFVYFNDSTPYVLAAQDDEQRMLIGPALIPDKRILRIDDATGEKYEVFFSPETVKEAAQRYMKEERTNQHTYEHEMPVGDVTVVESWLIEDEDKDKASLYGFKLPVGTWMLAVKVNNQAVWERVKEDKVRGFSIEGYFVDKLIEAQSVDLAAPCQHCPKDPQVMEQLKELVSDELNPIMEVNSVPLFATPEEADLYGQLFMNCKGSHTMNVLGRVLYMPCAAHQEVELESFSDYPQAVSNNAKRGIRLNEAVNNKCATQTGKVRAQQLAKGEPISEDTVARMYNFLSRHEQNYDPSDTKACGTISYLLWGGKAALRWSKAKLKELDRIE